MAWRGDGAVGGWAGGWAESQRQEQRRLDAQRREAERRQRDAERRQRAAEQAAARTQREQQTAYRQRREAEARQRTEEIDAQVDLLTGLLAAGCRRPAFRSGTMLRSEQVQPFDPGHLGIPVVFPNEADYRPASAGWGMGPNAQAQQEARARFERDWYAARDAEAQRVRQLEAYHQQYLQWAATTVAEARQHNAHVRTIGQTVGRGDAEAVVQYFSAALYASNAWPNEFPRGVEAAYDRGTRELVLDWQLPGLDVVPETKSVRYVAASDTEKETARSATARRTLYRDVLAQCVLLVIREVFGADEFGLVESVAVNGYVDDRDPATGRRARIVLVSARVAKRDFTALDLAMVSAVECIGEALRGSVSPRPDQRAAVPPTRRPDEVGGGVAVVAHGDDDDDPNLLEMDPIAFEGLVAALFQARGLQAVTTQRSGDGGVDVEAMDPDPLSGGKIIVQVKRYRNTVPPTAVRDLFGTVHAVGANKGVLVATSGFGPSSYTFVRDKPLTLINGEELVQLLRDCGLRGRLDGSGSGGAAGGTGSAGSAAGSGSGAGNAAGSRAGSRSGTRTPDGTIPAARTSAGGSGRRTSASRSAGTAATPPGTLPATGSRSSAGSGRSRSSGSSGRAAAAAAPARANASEDALILGMTWTGRVAIDVCALVCAGDRVLSDDYFVFYNNEQTPDGSVRTVTPTGTDKAALRLAFDALPARADRLVLVAAVDPAVDPRADLSGFTDAAIRLSDRPGGEALDSIDVSDGRPGETALVLGSFRRRSNGDWKFVLGGRGYPGGLEPLLTDFGIAVH
ncbi:restriction endonuclease [Yinghuangia soli]|uniref:Restriction endonuclease n=1 Tax=Yinghuangia soli TaxID=2908204 RepID=A0AA41TWH4_9ACTN|nr:restriction endonuclease [Yinghuangia soli]MCF2525853.1 restriction endonuclease [Yinghuangia soli]